MDLEAVSIWQGQEMIGSYFLFCYLFSAPVSTQMNSYSQKTYVHVHVYTSCVGYESLLMSFRAR